MKYLLALLLSLSSLSYSFELSDCVYHLSSEDSKYTWHGTAFALEINNHKYIITAAHTLKHSDTYRINGIKLRVVYIDTQLDLGILDIDCMELKDYLKLDDSELKVGDSISSISYPETKYTKSEGSITKIPDTDILVQGDLNGVYSGSSGGPVFNSKGKVIGVIVSCLSDSKGEAIRSKACFIPVKRLLMLVDYLDSKILAQYVNIEDE